MVQGLPVLGYAMLATRLNSSSDQPGRPGRFDPAAWLAGALAALAFAAGSACAAEDCTLKKLASVPLEFSSGGSPLITVRLNGSPRRFLIDTGALYSAVVPGVAQELGLKSRLIPGGGGYLNGKLMDQAATVERIDFGGYGVRRVDLLLLPLEDWAGIDGLLGAGLLMNFDLDFDFSRRTLNLFSPEHCKGRSVYWTLDYVAVPFDLTDGGHVVVPMMLDGKRVWTVIDTGASGIHLSQGRAARLFGFDDSVDSHRFESLSFEGITIKHPVIRAYGDDNARAIAKNHKEITPFDAATRLNPEQWDMLVGMSVLKDLHVYLSYKERTLYLSAAGAH
jgi:predicted aspartyl protease